MVKANSPSRSGKTFVSSCNEQNRAGKSTVGSLWPAVSDVGEGQQPQVDTGFLMEIGAVVALRQVLAWSAKNCIAMTTI